MNSNQVMIRKLRNAINKKGGKITYSTTEIFLENQPYPSTMYIIKQAEKNDKTGKNKYEELFHTFSQIQIVLFLRDYWYILNDIPLPAANPKWNAVRKTIPIFEQYIEEHTKEKVGE